MTSVLELDSFGVAFGPRVVLAEVNLRIAALGATILVGSAGGGKSTLLRTLAGLNDAQPTLRSWGTGCYLGSNLGDGPRPGIIVQNTRFLLSSVRENLASALPNRSTLTTLEQQECIARALVEADLTRLRTCLDTPAVDLPLVEQRLLSLSQAMCRRYPLLLVDEITAGLEEGDAAKVVAALRRHVTTGALLFATHNLRDARALGGTVVLLGGGRVVEATPSEQFFREPTTASGRQFLRTGGCSEPSPMAEPESLADDVPPPAPLTESALRAIRASPVPSAPVGFHWLRTGQLGGLPRPGLLTDVDEDLGKLAALGVTTLVTLEETRTLSTDVLARHSIDSVFFPIADMRAPEVREAIVLCEYLDTLLRRGAVVGIHCRAGLGRTGMMLVAHDIWLGSSAVVALDRARRINPRWVQSQEQLDFLVNLEAAVRTNRSLT